MCAMTSFNLSQNDDVKSQSAFLSASGKEGPLTAKPSTTGPDAAHPSRQPSLVSRRMSTDPDEFDQDYDTLYSEDDGTSLGGSSLFKSQPGYSRRHSVGSGDDASVEKKSRDDPFVATNPPVFLRHRRQGSDVSFGGGGGVDLVIPGAIDDNTGDVIAPARQPASSFEMSSLFPRSSTRLAVCARFTPFLNVAVVSCV